MTVALYYECHITLDYVADTHDLLKLSHPEGFKLAQLRMDKISVRGLTSEPSTILTGHSHMRDNLVTRMRSMIQILKTNGFRTLRYKIEDISMDSRTNDSEGLLS